jgi:hypothetical protein
MQPLYNAPAARLASLSKKNTGFDRRSAIGRKNVGQKNGASYFSVLHFSV